MVDRMAERMEKDACDVLQGQSVAEKVVRSLSEPPSNPLVEPVDQIVTQNSDAQECSTNQMDAEDLGEGGKIFIRSERAHSCPPKASRSVISGPWSLEWLHDHNYGEAGVIFSASKKVKKGDDLGVRHQVVRQKVSTKRNAGGPLRHPFHSIKKVARLPSKDRSAVLKALKKQVRRRRGGDDFNRSSMQGSEQMAVDDVWGIGKAIG
ncbi:hypothetical protein L195_g025187, partial [Trifolium pratense]